VSIGKCAGKANAVSHAVFTNKSIANTKAEKSITVGTAIAAIAQY